MQGLVREGEMIITHHRAADPSLSCEIAYTCPKDHSLLPLKELCIKHGGVGDCLLLFLQGQQLLPQRSCTQSYFYPFSHYYAA